MYSVVFVLAYLLGKLRYIIVDIFFREKFISTVSLSKDRDKQRPSDVASNICSLLISEPRVRRI